MSGGFLHNVVVWPFCLTHRHKHSCEQAHKLHRLDPLRHSLADTHKHTEQRETERRGEKGRKIKGEKHGISTDELLKNLNKTLFLLVYLYYTFNSLHIDHIYLYSIEYLCFLVLIGIKCWWLFLLVASFCRILILCQPTPCCCAVHSMTLIISSLILENIRGHKYICIYSWELKLALISYWL